MCKKTFFDSIFALCVSLYHVLLFNFQNDEKMNEVMNLAHTFLQNFCRGNPQNQVLLHKHLNLFLTPGVSIWVTSNIYSIYSKMSMSFLLATLMDRILFIFVHMCVLSHFSCVQLFAAPWAVVHQAPLSMEFSRQEYYSGLQCPPLGDFPYPGIEPVSLKFPALVDRFVATGATWEAPYSSSSPHFIPCRGFFSWKWVSFH